MGFGLQQSGIGAVEGVRKALAQAVNTQTHAGRNADVQKFEVNGLDALRNPLRNLPGKEDKYASMPLADMLREEEQGRKSE